MSTLALASQRWRIMPWIAAPLLLIAPAVAMQFTHEVQWSGGDFALMAVLLALVCGGFELAMRLSASWSYRLACLIALGGAFLMVWANLAVGIVGNPDNPANPVFFGVLAVGLSGALIARFRASGMARAMLAMAVAQALAALVEPHGFVLFFTVVYLALWLAAAFLFGRAARV